MRTVSPPTAVRLPAPEPESLQPSAGLTGPARGRQPEVEVDLEPVIRQIDEIGAALDESTDFRVILYNDDYHDIDDVVQVVRAATGCGLRQALTITLKAHQEGRAVAFEGTLSECEAVAGRFARVELTYEII